MSGFGAIPGEIYPKNPGVGPESLKNHSERMENYFKELGAFF
jgi:hypothetical protein